jgi:hypothetical protein
MAARRRAARLPRSTLLRLFIEKQRGPDGEKATTGIAITVLKKASVIAIWVGPTERTTEAFLEASLS